MSQSIEERSREATRAWAASITEESKKQEEASKRVQRALSAAREALGLPDLKGHPISMSSETATILAALITAYKE